MNGGMVSALYSVWLPWLDSMSGPAQSGIGIEEVFLGVETDEDREEPESEVSCECRREPGIFEEGPVPLSPGSIPLLTLMRVLFFLAPFNISLRGSLPLRRLSFDREVFASFVDSGSRAP